MDKTLLALAIVMVVFGAYMISGNAFSGSAGAYGCSVCNNKALPQAPPKQDSGNSTAPINNGVHDVYVKATSYGTYDHAGIAVKKGVPVRFHFSADPGAGCGRALIIPAFGVKLVSQNGEEQVAEFTPTEAGTYEYSCTMRMFRGTLKVV